VASSFPAFPIAGIKRKLRVNKFLFPFVCHGERLSELAMMNASARSFSCGRNSLADYTGRYQKCRAAASVATLRLSPAQIQASLVKKWQISPRDAERARIASSVAPLSSRYRYHPEKISFPLRRDDDNEIASSHEIIHLGDSPPSQTEDYLPPLRRKRDEDWTDPRRWSPKGLQRRQEREDERARERASVRASARASEREGIGRGGREGDADPEIGELESIPPANTACNG